MSTPQDPPYPMPPPRGPRATRTRRLIRTVMTRSLIRGRYEVEEMQRIVIKVPAVNADILEIGEDCTGFGLPNHIIEKIGQPFTDDQGWKMVEITLVERTP
jgi:hypothetical protein